MGVQDVMLVVDIIDFLLKSQVAVYTEQILNYLVKITANGENHGFCDLMIFYSAINNDENGCSAGICASLSVLSNHFLI